jgi:murein DD-endopeptidase MepM/ murein hydrolase activator NlpD
MKRFGEILLLIILAVFLAVGIPNPTAISASGTEGLVSQEITGISTSVHTVYRVYAEGELVGTLSRKSYLDSFLKKTYQDEYEETYPDSELQVGQDVSIVTEQTFRRYENMDAEICAYLKRSGMFSLKVTTVSLADDTDVYDRIYVLNKKVFTDALDDFLCLFVSEDELSELKKGTEKSELNSYGSQTVSLKIEQKISYGTGYAPVDEIYTEADDVFDYLCYGRNTTKKYDTFLGKDTLEGFAARHGLTKEELVRINPERLSMDDDTAAAGISLCVTYLQSPLSVTVVRHRLAQETDEPDVSYVINDAMAADGQTVLQEGVEGSTNCLYEETWVNGVLMKGSLISSYDVEKKTDEIIAIRSDADVLSGTGEWIMPVEHAMILADFDAYEGHEGIDLINLYDRYGSVLASDTGTVVMTGYDEEEGSYVIIDHHNGCYSHYGHLNDISVSIGDTVKRGQEIGQIGASGSAGGPELLFYLTEDSESGTHLDACDGFLDCEAYRQE